MRTIHSAKFYSENRERFLKKFSKIANFEHELTISLSDFDESLVDLAAYEEIKKSYAKMISDNAEKTLKEMAATIQDIKEGRASLGYTTERQEIQARNELFEGFEFACYMLSIFKSKYRVGR